MATSTNRTNRVGRKQREILQAQLVAIAKQSAATMNDLSAKNTDTENRRVFHMADGLIKWEVTVAGSNLHSAATDYSWMVGFVEQFLDMRDRDEALRAWTPIWT